MLNVLPIQILLITMVGTAAVIYAFSRCYILFSSLALRACDRKEGITYQKRQEKENLLFPKDLLHELQQSNKSLMFALFASWLTLVFFWFFAQEATRHICGGMMTRFQFISCGAFLFSEIIRACVNLILPARFGCRKNVMETMGKYNLTLLMAALYTAGRWLYSL